MIYVKLTPGQVLLRTDNPDELGDIRLHIPGIQNIEGKPGILSLPLSRRPVLALRHYLTAKLREGFGVDMGGAEIKSVLAKFADMPRDVDGEIDGNCIVLHLENFPVYDDILVKCGGLKRKDYSWSFPLSEREKLIAIIKARNLDISLGEKILNCGLPLLSGFDGTVASLRSIPIGELSYVRNNKTRTKKGKAYLTFEERLIRHGIANIYDLLTFFPMRYIDKSSPSSISNLVEGEVGTILGTISSITAYDKVRRNCKVSIQDSERHRVSTTFFSQPWIATRFKKDDNVMVTGKFSYWEKGGARIPQIQNATLEHFIFEGQNTVVPIYTQSEGLSINSQDISRCIKEALSRVDFSQDEVPVPDANLPIDVAFRKIHFPDSTANWLLARDSLVYRELLILQAHILSSKKQYMEAKGMRQERQSGGHLDSFLGGLPYQITGAQERTLQEIVSDMSNPVPMHRLLQGDVSSGKTTIAYAAMLQAVDNGHQGVIMAPTEILAEQLFLGISEFHPSVRVEFLGSKVKGKNRESVVSGIADGTVNIVIGTHALLVEDVAFKDLSMVVIDEQHRFGAAQRSVLRGGRGDGLTPDMLVMTATPIPRTGAMVIYGDLDVSVLDELPPGRVPIETEWMRAGTETLLRDSKSRIWAHISEEVKNGRQAYVVASLVEDSDSIAAASTEAAYETLKAGPLSHLRIGKIHGRMPRFEKELAMKMFANHEIDVLIATTVIEVGVNVPNATIMVILDATRFGIAQLHQIRGRVGRASWQSKCYLVGEPTTPESMARMSALVSSTDGFYLAEKDLEIRGEGALFGLKQSGDSDLMISSLRRDIKILEAARADAGKIVAENKYLTTLLEGIARSQYEGMTIAS